MNNNSPQVKLKQIAYLVGMPRAGTTFLYHNLDRHPQIYVPFRRKSNFFSLHRDKPLDWFLKHFSEMRVDQVGVDTETLHFADRERDSLAQISKHNPDAKVVLVVRKPGEWAWSLYKQILTFDSRVPPFEDFLAGDYALTEDGQKILFNLRDGDIKRKIQETMDTFGSNALILNFELLARDPLKFMIEIEKFLGLQSCFGSIGVNSQKINSSDRANVRFLAHLLRQEWLIQLLGILPRSIVVFMRKCYDSLSAKFKSPARDEASGTARKVALAEKHFASDEKYVDDLFRDGDVLHG